MVIILVVFDIAMMTFANIWRLSVSVKKLRAEAMLRHVLIEQNDIQDLTDQIFTKEDMRIQMTVQPYPGLSRLSQISLVAYDLNQNQLARVNEIIIRK